MEEKELTLQEYKKLNLKFLLAWLAIQLPIFIAFDLIFKGSFSLFIGNLVFESFAIYMLITVVPANILAIVFNKQFAPLKKKDTTLLLSILLTFCLVVGVYWYTETFKTYELVETIPFFETELKKYSNKLYIFPLILLSSIIAIILYYTNFSIKTFTNTPEASGYDSSRFKRLFGSSTTNSNYSSNIGISSTSIGHWRHKASNPSFYNNRWK